jgi:hypothetical protein
MTRLRPVVVPVAALALATAVPTASAQTRRPVTQWAHTPTAHAKAAQLADLPPRVALVQPATSLPLAVLTPSGEAAAPDVRHAPAASPAAAGAAGRPLLATARGPPA